MLAIASAIALRPKLLILDEPSANLAPKLAQQLYEKLVAIRNSGVTILMAEQNVKASLKISDKGLVLVSGKKVMEGPADETLNNKDLSRVFLGNYTRAEESNKAIRF